MDATVRLTVDLDVQVQMRDGTALATDIWRPAEPEPASVLLARTPYGKDDQGTLGNPKLPNVITMAEAGYVVVVQDVRGTGGSEGELVPHLHDADDGVDTLAWLLAQPWCDGRVGTWGGSYMGFVEWQTAARRPDGLAAMATTMSSADLYAAPWYSPGGALSLETTFNWAARAAVGGLRRKLGSGEGDPSDVAKLMELMVDQSALLAHMPLTDRPVLRRHMPWLADVLDHPARDSYWRAHSSIEGAPSLPVLHVSGWYDVFIDQTVRTYRTMRERTDDPEAHDGQRLVIGPWGHPDGADQGTFPDRAFGLAGNIGAADITGEHLRFFDQWLRGREADPVSRVRIFVMGADEWRDAPDWPLPGTRHTDHFLTSGGSANTASGDGVLTTSAPDADHHDTFTADPHDPVPSVGGTSLGIGNPCGPADQRDVESRPDVLCYTSPELTEPIEVIGHVSMSVVVSTFAPDADITGKLVDVHPDGTAILLCEGMLRCRYRESLQEPVLMEPGETYEVEVDLGVTANAFLPGHRIRLEVAGSNFPRYDRNTHTGGDVATDSLDDAVVATTTVHHGQRHPSRLVLPVVTS